MNPPIPYLHGLCVGDVTVQYDRHLHKYRVQLKTTHPAMEKVFIKAFQPYSIDGIIRKYPVKGGATPYEWTLYTWIPQWLGEVLSNRDSHVVKVYEKSLDELIAFISGLMDSDGSIIISIKRRRRLNYTPLVEYEISIYSSNRPLLINIKDVLAKYGIKMNLRKNSDVTRKTKRKGHVIVWQLYTSKTSEITKLLSFLLKYMKNEDRIEKALLLKRMIKGEIPKDPTLISKLRNKINSKIMKEVNKYIKDAERCYKNKIKYLIYQDGIYIKSSK